MFNKSKEDFTLLHFYFISTVLIDAVVSHAKWTSLKLVSVASERPKETCLIMWGFFCKYVYP